MSKYRSFKYHTVRDSNPPSVDPETDEDTDGKTKTFTSMQAVYSVKITTDFDPSTKKWSYFIGEDDSPTVSGYTTASEAEKVAISFLEEKGFIKI